MQHRHRASSLAAVAGALAGLLAFDAAIAAPEGAPPQLASHRAVYALSLGTARSGSSTLDARGAMYIELGASCDGWTVSQRVRLTLYAAQGGDVDTDSNFSSWEARDGQSYRFTVRNLRDGEVSEEFRGSARLSGDGHGGDAIFTTPPDKRFDLPRGSLFPTEHLIKLIMAAQQGHNRFSRVIFDGANLDGPLEVNAIIGRSASAGTTAGLGGELTNRIAWPMRMAFFPLRSQKAEPEYEVSVRLSDNGVAHHFLLDYGDFTVNAALTKIEPIAEPKC